MMEAPLTRPALDCEIKLHHLDSARDYRDLRPNEKDRDCNYRVRNRVDYTFRFS